MDTLSELISNITDINSKINDRIQERKSTIISNQHLILNAVLRKMDWSIENLSSYTINYSNFDDKIMVEIRLKNEKSVRYVFSIGEDARVYLDFREDFSKSLV